MRCVSVCLALLFAMLFPFAAFAQERVVVCESIDNRTVACPVGYADHVELIRQLSRSSCIEGRDWWVERGDLVVTRGCRGEFLVHERRRGRGRGWDDGYGRGHGGEVVRCESIDQRPQACRIGRHGGVELIERHSDARCREGREWWVEGRDLIVTRGCRADFLIHR